jgi:hypothetical protein
MAYKLTDRLKEWTSYVGVAVGAIGVAVPQLVPAAQWAHVWADAQLVPLHSDFDRLPRPLRCT